MRNTFLVLVTGAATVAAVELPDGTVLDPDDAVLGMAVGRTILECEAGEWVGRLALDHDQRIVGMLGLPPDHGPPPF